MLLLQLRQLSRGGGRRPGEEGYLAREDPPIA
jgi:hypothetical protein